VTHQRFTPTAFLTAYAILALTVLGLLAYNEFLEIRHNLAQNFEKSEALADRTAEQALRMFEMNDIALRTAVERFATRDLKDEQHLEAEWNFLLSLQRSNLATDLPRVQHIQIIDDQGLLKLDSRVFPASPLDLSARDYFTFHRDKSTANLFIASPTPGVNGAEYTFPISRRINAPDGRFIGVAAASISHDISADFYQSLGVGRRAILFVMDSDGRILNFHPANQRFADMTVPNSAIAAALTRGDLSGTVMAPCCFDDETRILSFHRVGRLPLYVAVGLARNDILGPWMRSAIAHIGIAMAVLIGFGVLIWLLVRQYRHQIVAHGLLSATYDAANTGFCMIDSLGRMVRANKAFGRLCGRSVASLVGQPYNALFAPGDEERTNGMFRASVDGRAIKPQTLHIRHADGDERTALVTIGHFEDAAGQTFLVLAANDVTERQRQEERLRESERQLQEAQRIAGIGWWTVNPEDGMVRWSETLFDVWGHAIPFQPTLQRWLASIHPDDRPRIEESSLTSGDSIREYRIIRPDGTVRHIRDEFTRDIDEFGQVTRLFGIIQDVTLLRQNERALALSEARLRAILDVAVTGIVVIGYDGRIDMFNPAAEQMFGYSTAEVKHLTVTDLVPTDSVDPHAPPLHRHRAADDSAILGVTREVIARTKDGHTFPAYFAIDEFNADGRPMFVGVILDISDQKRREQEIFQARDRLEQQATDLASLACKLDQALQDAELARATAEAANRAKSEFLAHMSHELRTPLNAILGFSEIMEHEYFGPLGSPRYTEYNRNIYDSACHLLSLINDILDLSKIEAGRYELDEQRVDLGRAVEAVTRLIRERALRKDLALRVSVESLPPIQADERAVKQIIINLLTNAVKFTPNGGQIDLVGQRDDDGGIKLTVRDNGIGIEEDQIPKVLETFGQARNAYMAGESGTGLGLPIVRSLVGLHGGTMILESKVGVGTTVTVRLPRIRVLDQPVLASIAAF
jgi:PAS domain S-box-containing protein